MSADLNVNQIEEKISGLDQPEAVHNTSADCNGNGKVNRENDHDPVNAVDSVAEQVGELKGDRVESESETGFLKDQIKKEEDFQGEREEKLVDIPEDGDVEGNRKELINHDELTNAVAEEPQDNSVDVAEFVLTQSSNAEEESKLDSAVGKKEEEVSQAVVINGVHIDLDLDQQRDLAELITAEDVAASKPNQSGNDEEKVEESKLDAEDSQAVVSNGVHNNLDLDQEKEPKELMDHNDVTESKLKQSSNDGEKVEKESKLDSTIHVEGIEDSQAVVINGVHNNVDLDQEKQPSELINDVPLEDSGEVSGDSFEQNLKTSPCAVVADEKLEAECAEGCTSDEIRDGLPAGHAQDTAAETHAVNGLVDAKKNMSKCFFENVELVTTYDDETGKSFPIASDNGSLGEATSHILTDTAQSELPDANGLDIHENGGLYTSQETGSQAVPVNDFFHSPEKNHNSENSKEVSSPVHEDTSVESCESFTVSPINDDIVAVPAVQIEDSCPVEDTKFCEIVKTQTEADNVHANGGESADSHSVDNAEVEDEVENGPVVDYTTSSCPTNEVKPDIETGSHSIESEEKVSTLSRGNVDVESDVTEAVTEGASSTSVSVDNPVGETLQHDSTENQSHVPQLEVQTKSATAPSAEVPNRDGLVSRFEDSDDSAVAIDEVQTDSTTAPSAEVHNRDGLVSQFEDSDDSAIAIDASDEQNVAVEVVNGPFYIIKVPKFDDKREKVEDANFQVDQKSKSRDAIQAQIQILKTQRSKDFETKVTEAREVEKSARNLLKAKRKEIDSVQSVIDKARIAQNVEEIDGRIRNMEHQIQHETLPLKEEKHFIREIKQLKQHREKLSSDMGSQDEVQQAMDQKNQSEERLKSLRKEADVLRQGVLKAEAVSKDAMKKYNEENEKINKLIDDHKAANELRQQAFAHLQSLKKQSYEKNKFFYKYKNDLTAATNLALKGDKEELRRHCANQVERVMELWNNNDEFRKEYVRSNTRSTIRRLRTLDGRALGPDEKPPIIPDAVIQRVAKHDIAPSAPAFKVEKPVAPVETQKIEDKSGAKFWDQKNQTLKTKKQAKPASLESGLPTVSGRDQIEEPIQEENKRTKEEEELARNEEKLKKEKEAAILKEQQRLEEKAKAKEAMERKQRNAAKAQAKASRRAQREAEAKEKEKEKKAMKKEKKAAAAQDTKDVLEVESAPSSEILTEANESERTEKPVTLTKRPQKPSQFAKQTKAKSMPLPLRNRGKRKMQTWMWALITLLAVIALFFMGNSSFFNFGLQQRSGI